ncbi:MAG: site-specific integrase [Fimbriiglobus sp.]|nr:site-specific integrase [Fimbriiglobus sp.]
MKCVTEGRPYGSSPGGLTLADVLLRYWKAVGNGLPEKERFVVQMVSERAAISHGDLPLHDFGPKAVRDWLRWLAAGSDETDPRGKYVPLSSGTIRRYLRLLKATLRWAVTEEVVRADDFRWAEIKDVRASDVQATAPERVLPVDPEVLAKTVPHLLPPVRALVQIQLLTGMRPNDELFLLRPADVHPSGRVTLSTGVVVNLDKNNDGSEAKVWVYVPRWHKQQYAGAGRDVALGPQAQTVLLPFLLRPPEQFCFSPREALAWQLEDRSRPDNRLGSWQAHMERPAVLRLNERYTADSYRQAIHYACRKAGVPEWFPYQLRHTAATEAAAEDGLEVARALLGQSDPRTTARYAERDFRAAAERVRRAG